MKIHELKPVLRNKKRIRVGRGISAGKGKTAGRGTKGQKSRTGKSIPIGFEGGQTPLKMRLPKKRGFYVPKRPKQIINLDRINNVFKDGETVSSKTLAQKKLIKSEKLGVKILGTGELDKKLIFENVICSKSVIEKINKSKSIIKDKNKKDKLLKTKQKDK